MGKYDSYDLDWTWDGDLALGDDGDLKDTSDDAITSLLNEIRTIIRSELGDWQMHGLLGSNLSDFLGEPNTQETALAIEERISSSLITFGTIDAKDITVRVIPVQRHMVMVIITISAEATQYNSLTAGEPVKVTLTYDTLEDTVFFLEGSELIRQGR